MKVNQKKLEAYRKTHGREIFCTREHTYDVVAAQFLLEQDDRDPESVNVEELAEQCGFTSTPVDEYDGYLIFQCPDGSGKTKIDAQHVQMQLDLSKPLIFASDRLIDGHHRLYRAFMLGIETLNAHTLTSEESKVC